MDLPFDPQMEDLTTVTNQTEVFLHRWVLSYQREAARKDLANLIAMEKGQWWPRHSARDYDGLQARAVEISWLCCRRTVFATHVSRGCGKCR